MSFYYLKCLSCLLFNKFDTEDSFIYNRIRLCSQPPSLSVSRLGLTREERHPVTLMHHGCWRTHMHTPRHRLSHPISLFPPAHTPVSWYPCAGQMCGRGLLLVYYLQVCLWPNAMCAQSQKSSLRLINGTALHFRQIGRPAVGCD